MTQIKLGGKVVESMAHIKEFIVIEPPTSGEVREHAFEALEARGSLRLTVLGTQEVPKPEPEEVAFNIHQTSQLTEGGMRLVGRNAVKDSISVTIDSQATLPAIGDFVQ